MIKRDYFGRPFAQDAAYKFGFCKYCPFYECELVEEYQQFIKVHCKNDAEDKFQPWKDADDGWHIKGVSTPRIEIGRTQVPAPASVTAADISSEIKALSYNPNDIKDCLMSHRYVCPIECGRQRVTEGVGDHFRVETNPNGDIKAGIKDRWEPIQPVFISAQTGQGKNYFIENTLIPYVRELNYNNTTRHKVLILSNRLALKQQISKRLKGDNYTDDEENGIYSYKDVADVMTYQSLLHQAHRLKKIQKDAHSRYIYVVCDEAHFFTSDAMFNPHTAKILSAIVALFQKSIRVYMSATPYECLEYIIKEEDDYWKCRNTGKPQDKWTSAMMVFYHFKRDYGYLDIKTYSDVSELFGIIAKSVNKKDGGRWLIFIDDKDKCETLKCKLEQYECSKNDDVATGETEGASKSHPLEGKILAVNAGSKSDELYMTMVKSEQLDKGIYVLITTSVLDNGVNLKNIDNIVVSNMSKVKCLQMAGRARVRVGDPTDRKTLYVKRFGAGEVEKQITALEQQKDAYHSYELAYGELRDSNQSRGQSEYRFLERYYNGNVKDWINAKYWFGRPVDSPTKLYLNEIAKFLLDSYNIRYKNIYDEMIGEAETLDNSQLQEGVNYAGQIYLEHQLSWFGKKYNRDDDVTFADKDRAKKVFIAFLESYVACTQIEKDKQAEFRAEFTKLQDAAFGRKDRNKNRDYSITKMNSILEEEGINYKIVTHSSYWKVEEHDWSEEEE